MDRWIRPETDMERWAKRHGRRQGTYMDRCVWPETNTEMDGQIDGYGQTDIDKVVWIKAYSIHDIRCTCTREQTELYRLIG